MWKKRVIAICMIVSMLVAVLPGTPAVAAGSDSEYMDIGSCGTNMTYVLGKDGVLRIAGDGEMTDFTSASAVPWHKYRQLITGVAFSGNVKNVSAHAFEYCVELTDVILPETMTGLGVFAFRGCTQLTNVLLPEGLKSIGASAFLECKSLNQITIPDSVESIGEEAFDGTGIDTSEMAFRKGSCGENITWAMRGNYRLYINGTGKMTDFSAASVPWYEYREKITKIVLSPGITHIGDYAFQGCKGISEVILPDSLTSIGRYAFSSCGALKEIRLNKNVTSIAERAFSKAGLEKVTIIGSDSLAVGEAVFADCAALRQVTFAGAFERLGTRMFSGCKALDDKFTLPEGLTELGNYVLQNCTGITKLQLPKTLKKINEGAFSGCAKIKAFTLPPSVENIGKRAFEKCTELKEMVVGDTVKEIGEGAFSACSGLERMTLPFAGGIPDSEESSAQTLFGYIFGTTSFTGGTATKQFYSDKSSVTYYVPDTLEEVTITGGILRYGAFDKCGKLKTIRLEGAVTEVAPYMYRDCTGLSRIELGSRVSAVRKGAFSGCTGLSEITIPDGVQTIEEEAFAGCSELVSAKLPEKTVCLPASIFRSCTKLKQITMLNRLESIGDYAFSGCAGLGEWNLPATLKELGKGVWKDCTGIRKMNLPSGITSIEDELFMGCEALQEVTIPLSVTGIGSQAFSGCQALQKIAFPGQLEKIGAYACKNCTGLETVLVPDSVTEIGNGAFAGCSGLTGITLPFIGNKPDEATSSASTVFGYIFGTTSYTGGTATRQNYSKSSSVYYIPTSLRTVTITGGSLPYGAFSNCSGLTKITLPEKATVLGGYAFQNCTGLTELNLPSGLTELGDYAFQGCSGLKKIKVPGKVTTIGKYTFAGCSGLQSMELSETVRAIGSAAFSGCSGLKYMTLPFVGSGNQTKASLETLFGYIFGTTSYTGGTATRQYTTTGSSTYYIPTSLRSVQITGGEIFQGAFYNCNNLTNILLPDELTAIGTNAFYNCSALTQLTVPTEVTSVQQNAFTGCTEMKSVTFLGSAPAIHEKAFTKDVATVYYPQADPSWSACVGNQYGGTLTWEAHTHRYTTSVVAPTCTEQGYTIYQCMDCKSYYLSQYVSETGHKPVADVATEATCMKPGLSEGSHCSVCNEALVPQETVPALAHHFTAYTSNQDATYEADGTKTAVCEYGCGTKDTVADSGSRLQDTKPPVLEIVSGTSTWKTVLNTITFGLFFQKTQRVTIQASDEEILLDGSKVNRLKQVSYFISDKAIPSAQLATLSWSEYDRVLSLNPGKAYIVYARAVDRSGNVAYASTNGIIVDNEFPTIEGVTDGKGYCEEAVFSVSDLSLAKVTDNGNVLTPVNGKYRIVGDDLKHVVTATDHCGNTVSVNITVYRGHVWSAYVYNNDVTCTTSGTKTASCTYGCGMKNTVLDESHPAAGHRYASPVWNWAADSKSCTALFICETDNSHREEKNCDVTASSADATCMTRGEVVYTASAASGDKTWTDTKTVADAVLGHDYAVNFHWGEDRKTCMADMVCRRTGCTQETEGHEKRNVACTVKMRTTAASCVQEGKEETVAEVTVDGITYSDVGNTERLPVDAAHHVHTQILNRQEATCRNTGYSGDVYCNDCKKQVESGEYLEKTSHAWDSGKIIREASEEETGIIVYTCLVCGEERLEAVPALEKQPGEETPAPPVTEPPAEQTPEPDTSSWEKPPVPTPPASGITVPSQTNQPLPPQSTPGQMGEKPGQKAPAEGTILTDKAGGACYRVTGAQTVCYMKQIKASEAVTVPDAVTIDGRTYSVTGIAAKAFKGSRKIKKVVIGSQIKTIGKQAFYGCRNLKSITVRTKKLTKRTVGSKAFAKIHKKAVVRVPAKKWKSYRKMLKKRGVSGKKQKIRK